MIVIRVVIVTLARVGHVMPIIVNAEILTIQLLQLVHAQIIPKQCVVEEVIVVIYVIVIKVIVAAIVKMDHTVRFFFSCYSNKFRVK